MLRVPPWDALPERSHLEMWRIISGLVTLLGLVAMCTLHWSVWLHGGGETLTAQPGVSAVIPDQALRKKHVLAITHQERAKGRQQRASNEEPRRKGNGSTFYNPSVMGGVVTRIPLLYWATAARAMPYHALGPETVSVAHLVRHSEELLTLHRACSLSWHSGPGCALSAV